MLQAKTIFCCSFFSPYNTILITCWKSKHFAVGEKYWYGNSYIKIKADYNGCYCYHDHIIIIYKPFYKARNYPKWYIYIFFLFFSFFLHWPNGVIVGFVQMLTFCICCDNYKFKECQTSINMFILLKHQCRSLSIVIYIDNYNSKENWG